MRRRSSLLHRALLLALLARVTPACAADALPTVENPWPASQLAAPEGMVWIPGGEFSFGTAENALEVCGGIPQAFAPAQPWRRIYVEGFWLDRTEVTNAQFAEFVAATGYLTIAERPLSPEDYPGVPAHALVPGSLVFSPPAYAVSLDNPLL